MKDVRQAECSVSGAGGGGIVSGDGASANRVGESGAGAVEDVPEVAEVDGVVKVGHALGAGLGGDGAASAVGGVLEELVISVLSVQSDTGGPDVVVVGLLLEGVGATGGRGGGGVPGADLVVHKGVEGVAGDTVELGGDVAAGVEGAVLGEVALGGGGDGGEGGDSEGLHGI